MDDPTVDDGYRFCVELEVDGSVIDELGHVSNIAYLGWALAAAKAHSMAVGYDPEKSASAGEAFVVRRHEIDYHRPVFEGDRVEIFTWVSKWSSASTVRETEIRTMGDKPALVAKLSTQWVWAALPSGRPKRIPAELRTAYESFRG